MKVLSSVCGSWSLPALIALLSTLSASCGPDDDGRGVLPNKTALVEPRASALLTGPVLKISPQANNLTYLGQICLEGYACATNGNDQTYSGLLPGRYRILTWDSSAIGTTTWDATLGWVNVGADGNFTLEATPHLVEDPAINAIRPAKLVTFSINPLLYQHGMFGFSSFSKLWPAGAGIPETGLIPDRRYQFIDLESYNLDVASYAFSPSLDLIIRDGAASEAGAETRRSFDFDPATRKLTVKLAAVKVNFNRYPGVVGFGNNYKKGPNPAVDTYYLLKGRRYLMFDYASLDLQRSSYPFSPTLDVRVADDASGTITIDAPTSQYATPRVAADGTQWVDLKVGKVSASSNAYYYVGDGALVGNGTSAESNMLLGRKYLLLPNSAFIEFSATGTCSPANPIALTQGGAPAGTLNLQCSPTPMPPPGVIEGLGASSLVIDADGFFGTICVEGQTPSAGPPCATGTQKSTYTNLPPGRHRIYSDNSAELGSNSPALGFIVVSGTSATVESFHFDRAQDGTGIKAKTQPLVIRGDDPALKPYFNLTFDHRTYWTRADELRVITDRRYSLADIESQDLDPTRSHPFGSGYNVIIRDKIADQTAQDVSDEMRLAFDWTTTTPAVAGGPNVRMLTARPHTLTVDYAGYAGVIGFGSSNYEHGTYVGSSIHRFRLLRGRRYGAFDYGSYDAVRNSHYFGPAFEVFIAANGTLTMGTDTALNFTVTAPSSETASFLRAIVGSFTTYSTGYFNTTGVSGSGGEVPYTQPMLPGRRYFVAPNGVWVTFARTGECTPARINPLSQGGMLDITCSIAAPPLAPPTNLVATALSGSRIKLDWTPTSATVGHRIERSTNGFFGGLATTINVPPGTSTHYDVAGLQPNTKYDYRVRTANGPHVSAASPVVSAVTGPPENPILTFPCHGKADGDSCSDGNPCNGQEACQAGSCVPGPVNSGDPALAACNLTNHPQSWPDATVNLVAQRTCNASGVETGRRDAERTFAPAAPFLLPGAFQVRAGSAGGGELVLSLREGGSAVTTCRYRGGATGAANTDLAQAQGRSYDFVSCSNGAGPGSAVSATWAGLSIVGSDCSQYPFKTEVELATGDNTCAGVLAPPISPAESVQMRDAFSWAATQAVDPRDAQGRPQLYYANIYLEDRDQVAALDELYIHHSMLPIFGAEARQWDGQCGRFLFEGDGKGVFTYAILPGELYNRLREAALNPDPIEGDGTIFRVVKLLQPEAPLANPNGSIVWDALAASGFRYMNVEAFPDDDTTEVHQFGLFNALKRRIVKAIATFARGTAREISHGFGKVDRFFAGEVTARVDIDVLNRDPAFHTFNPATGQLEPTVMRRQWGSGKGQELGVPGVRVIIKQWWGISPIPTLFYANTDGQGRANIRVAKNRGQLRDICITIKNQHADFTSFLTTNLLCGFGRENVFVNGSDINVPIVTAEKQLHALAQMSDVRSYVGTVGDVIGVSTAEVLTGWGANKFTGLGGQDNALAPCFGFPNLTIDVSVELARILAAGTTIDPTNATLRHAVVGQLAPFFAVDIVIPDDVENGIDNTWDSRGVPTHEYGHYVFCDFLGVGNITTTYMGAILSRIDNGGQPGPNNHAGYINEAFADLITSQVAGGTNYFTADAENPTVSPEALGLNSRSVRGYQVCVSNSVVDIATTTGPAGCAGPGRVTCQSFPGPGGGYAPGSFTPCCGPNPTCDGAGACNCAGTSASCSGSACTCSGAPVIPLTPHAEEGACMDNNQTNHPVGETFYSRIARLVTLMHDAFDGHGGAANAPHDGDGWHVDPTQVGGQARISPSTSTYGNLRDETVAMRGKCLHDIVDKWDEDHEFLNDVDWEKAIADVAKGASCGSHNWCQLCQMFAIHRQGTHRPDATPQQMFEACTNDYQNRLGSPPAPWNNLVMSTCSACPTGATTSDGVTCTCPAGQVVRNGACTPCGHREDFVNGACVPCLDRQIFPNGKCEECPAGTHRWGIGNEFCVTCIAPDTVNASGVCLQHVE